METREKTSKSKHPEKAVATTPAATFQVASYRNDETAKKSGRDKHVGAFCVDRGVNNPKYT